MVYSRRVMATSSKSFDPTILPEAWDFAGPSIIDLNEFSNLAGSRWATPSVFSWRQNPAAAAVPSSTTSLKNTRGCGDDS